MITNKLQFILPSAFLLLLFSACRQPCNDTDQKLVAAAHTDLQTTCKIDKHLYEFVLSRLYVLNCDTLPARNLIIEFAVRDNDTLFEISVLSEIYKDLLRDVKIGSVATDDFRLFVLDKDKVGSSFYQIDSVWPSEQLPYDRSPAVMSMEGMVLDGKFFARFSSMDYPDCDFILDRSKPIR